MAKKLGIVIRDLRKKKGMNVREFAKKVGVSFATISYIENGRVDTKTEILNRIADVLEYDKDKLLSLADRVDDEIKGIINKMPDEVPAFLRTAKNLSKADWKELKDMIEKKNNKG